MNKIYHIKHVCQSTRRGWFCYLGEMSHPKAVRVEMESERLIEGADSNYGVL